jgi:hypothetical protein
VYVGLPFGRVVAGLEKSDSEEGDGGIIAVVRTEVSEPELVASHMVGVAMGPGSWRILAVMYGYNDWRYISSNIRMKNVDCSVSLQMKKRLRILMSQT